MHSILLAPFRYFPPKWGFSSALKGKQFVDWSFLIFSVYSPHKNISHLMPEWKADLGSETKTSQKIIRHLQFVPSSILLCENGCGYWKNTKLFDTSWKQTTEDCKIRKKDILHQKSKWLLGPTSSWRPFGPLGFVLPASGTQAVWHNPFHKKQAR